VLDAGTGIRPLGLVLVGDPRDLFVLLTHRHADHLLGFPFFAPLYEDGRPVHLLPLGDGSERWWPLALFDGVLYPLHPSDLPSAVANVDADAMDHLRQHGFDVRRHAVNHPGGAYGYRVEDGGRAFVFVPDNEIGAPDPVTSRADLVAFCHGADVLCHDAQYLGSEMEGRRGWGHSSVEEACDLAADAAVGHLVLFHHDPNRTDDELDAIQDDARHRLAPHGVAVTVASQGLTFALEPHDPDRATPGEASPEAERA